MHRNTRASAIRSLLLAAASGAVWGMARPDLLGAVCLLAGSLLAAHALTGRLLVDAAAGLLAGVVWMGLALDWVPEALSLYGVGDGTRLTAALVTVQAAPLVLPWVVSSWLVRRGTEPAWALGVAWLACAEPVAWCQPLPLPPALLLSGTVLALWPAALGGIALLCGVAVGAAAALPRPGGALAVGAWALVGGLWLDQPPAPDTVRVAVVQPDTGAFDGRRASTAPERTQHLLALIARTQDAQLVVTPETAWPVDVGGDGSHARRTALAAWADLPPLVLGVTIRDGPTNSLLAIEGGQVTARFDKVLRVPVTERQVGSWGRDAFVAGARPRALSVAGLRLGPLICFEDGHPAAVRDAVSLAPTLLIAAANDAWTGPHGGTAWHLGAARLAAVSAGRAVVRAATSGPSAVIDSRGRLLAQTAWVDGDTHPSAGSVLVATVERSTPSWCGASLSPFWTALGWLLALGLTFRRPLWTDVRRSHGAQKAARPQA